MKILAIILLLFTAYAINFFMLMFGWGISPQNIPIIVGCYFATFVVFVVSQALGAK